MSTRLPDTLFAARAHAPIFDCQLERIRRRPSSRAAASFRLPAAATVSRLCCTTFQPAARLFPSDTAAAPVQPRRQHTETEPHAKRVYDPSSCWSARLCASVPIDDSRGLSLDDPQQRTRLRTALEGSGKPLAGRIGTYARVVSWHTSVPKRAGAYATGMVDAAPLDLFDKSVSIRPSSGVLLR